jgi:flagellar motor switch protein FliN
MTVTTDNTAVSVPALSQLVLAGAACFPADGLVPGPADTQDDLNELLPAEDALVLALPVADSDTMMIVAAVSPELLPAMGLSDADGLTEVLAPVIAALAGDRAVAADQARIGVGPIGLAGVPITGQSPGAVLVAAGVFLGSDHVATVGIGIAGGPIDTDTDTDTDDQANGGLDLPEVGSPRSQAGVNGATSSAAARSLDLLRDVQMDVTAELGRTKMTVADLLSLATGSVVELDRAAGSPIDLLVNGTLIARGEVVVIDEEFGLRISEIVDRTEGA